MQLISGSFPAGTVAALTHAPLLTHLDLRAGVVDDSDASCLAQATCLQKLSLCAIPLSKEFLRLLAPSTSLTKLSLAGCGISLVDLNVLALYNQSLLQVNFFALEKTSALSYHLAANFDRAKSYQSSFVQRLLLLNRARASGSHAKLTTLPIDILIVIMGYLPAPAYGKFSHQIVACARYILLLPQPKMVEVLRNARIVLHEHKNASHWTLINPSFSF